MIIAVIDLVYQRYEHYKKMRMTKQEVKDEYKQSEGDLHVKARLRQLRAERARQRMMQSVPTGRCGDHQPDALFDCIKV